MNMVLGDYFDVITASYFYTSNKMKANKNDLTMARIKDVWLFIGQYMDSDKKLKGSILELISCNNIIQARYLYKKSISFMSGFTPIVEMNRLPVIIDLSKDLEKRLACIHFPNVFVEKPVKPNK